MSKTIEKAIKVLGNDQANEILSLSEDQLKNVIVNSTREIETAKVELESNPEYKSLMENKKALSGGYRDLKKLLSAKIVLAVEALENRGK